MIDQQRRSLHGGGRWLFNLDGDAKQRETRYIWLKMVSCRFSHDWGTNKSDWLKDSYSNSLINVLVKESEDLVMLSGSFTCWEGL